MGSVVKGVVRSVVSYGAFVAIGDPTNLHAIDEIRFGTGLGVEAIVVEDDKLQKAIDKALEQVDNQMSALADEGDVDLESLEVSGGEVNARIVELEIGDAA